MMNFYGALPRAWLDLFPRATQSIEEFQLVLQVLPLFLHESHLRRVQLSPRGIHVCPLGSHQVLISKLWPQWQAAQLYPWRPWVGRLYIFRHCAAGQSARMQCGRSISVQLVSKYTARTCLGSPPPSTCDESSAATCRCLSVEVVHHSAPAPPARYPGVRVPLIRMEPPSSSLCQFMAAQGAPRTAKRRAQSVC